MMLYLLKSILCLGFFLVFYSLFLEREKKHHFNRFYLLGSLFFSIAIPFIPISMDVMPLLGWTEVSLGGMYESATLGEVNALFNDSFVPTSIWIGLYLVISLVLMGRFVRNVWHMIHLVRTHPKIYRSEGTLVLLPDPVLPHTFLKYVFLNQEAYERNQIVPELMTHEFAHLAQKHSLDILLIEWIHIFFWFNPGLMFLKKAIRLNHEFLADQATIRQHPDISAYQKLLLERVGKGWGRNLVHGFNYAFTKKRFLMMNRPASASFLHVRQWLVLPLCCLLGLTFSHMSIDASNPDGERINQQLPRTQNMIEEQDEDQLYRPKHYKDRKKGEEYLPEMYS